ncbi:serine protease Do [Sporobacter termitidis DSM 10068]|uniref:Serine protease Do n=1 Tax=Sporobacter termitidis DSM 10068 TaxID=1123282 RepID=A0A1M5UJS3_9FIRM|nr:trypsin-like peptidase domain-containing protein [Sporobacter termitidis]SHH63170.1 serine protease Do [Sporobacter termitidis DSM 10068]
MDGNNRRFFRHKAVKAAAITISSLLLLAIISLASIGAYTLVTGSEDRQTVSSSSAAADTVAAVSGTTPAVSSGAAKLTTTSTVSGTALDSEQVYNQVKDSIVTVENYTAQSVQPYGEGSGIIMSADGYIITNEHVIDGASSIQVVTTDGKKYDAKLVGSDLRTDLAVLKVDATGLQAAAFGDSDTINVAEPVLAIGNPGGIEFSGSVTEGIVSALDRDVTTQSGYTEQCIQTDAAINPGNSGGALVNMQGQVIGITSSKIVAQGFEGMGFAIPINTAQPVVNDIIENGYVTGRVKLGISVSEFSADRASALGYPAGLLVQAVDSSSDAAAQGLQTNDIITKVNDTAVTTYDQFYEAESQFKAGDTITLTVFRYTTGKTMEVSVKLLEDKGTAAQTSQSSTQQYAQSPFGFGYSQ